MSMELRIETIELSQAEISQALVVAAHKKKGYYYGQPDAGYSGKVDFLPTGCTVSLEVYVRVN